MKRVDTGGSIVESSLVVQECPKTIRRVILAGCIVQKRIAPVAVFSIPLVFLTRAS
jgi:hypothetical protein